MVTVKVLLVMAALVLYTSVRSQTIIATSGSGTATANHNQRKIARDSKQNLYVFYEDIEAQGPVIRMVRFDRENSRWYEPRTLANGRSPAAAIGIDDSVRLFYESCESVSRIVVTVAAPPCTVWSQRAVLDGSIDAAHMPVADADSAGNTHVAWLEDTDRGTRKLMYARYGKQPRKAMVVCSRGEDVYDAAVANHLVFRDNTIYCTYAFRNAAGDSYIQVLCMFEDDNVWVSMDSLSGREPVFPLRGESPCLAVAFPDSSYEPNFGFMYHGVAPVILYRDSTSQLRGITWQNMFPWYHATQKEFDRFILYESLAENATYVIIDNPVFNYGFSYIYLSGGKLLHVFDGFAFTSMLKDEISGNPLYPTMTYKHFNRDFIDVVWMSANGSRYDLYYKRMAKGLNSGINVPYQGEKKGAGDIAVEHIGAGYRFLVSGTLSPGKLSVHDAGGRELWSSTLQKTILWNGCDRKGRAIATQVCVVVVTSGSTVISRRLMVSRE